MLSNTRVYTQCINYSMLEPPISCYMTKLNHVEKATIILGALLKDRNQIISPYGV
jgi:hypothetical protein